ncbi:hypothetical protein LF1_20150 [Rubripirellula obstinata]|uniref:Uncharacterized protein n=1 Tax=Rubripirellula obstinata TaxID=406547 RepID=A0A5B1CGZ6_9BACT|nr:hypothetical protein LF1_20150 [Rubripirellula obstinata]
MMIPAMMTHHAAAVEGADVVVEAADADPKKANPKSLKAEHPNPAATIRSPDHRPLATILISMTIPILQIAAPTQTRLAAKKSPVAVDVVGEADVDEVEAIVTETKAIAMKAHAVIEMIAAIEMIVTAATAKTTIAMTTIPAAVEAVVVVDLEDARIRIRKAKAVNPNAPPCRLGWRPSISSLKTTSKTTKRPKRVAAVRVVETEEDVASRQGLAWPDENVCVEGNWTTLGVCG